MRPERLIHKLETVLQSNPKGAAHACSGNSFRGGVSRRFTRRLRGQSTVEYVLVIAIIGLVVLIAGAWVSSAIRNQFNTVAGTLGNGIDKGSWETGSTGGGNGSLTDADIVDPVAERPRAGAVGLDAVKWVNLAVIPFDPPGSIFAVWAAFDQGGDQADGFLALLHEDTPFKWLANACSIVAQEKQPDHRR